MWHHYGKKVKRQPKPKSWAKWSIYLTSRRAGNRLDWVYRTIFNHTEHVMHYLITTWFQWVHDWGYWGVVILMAMESSIIPVPSEVVMPPAAFWAAQGRMDFWGVVLAGTVGSYIGSIINYFVSRWVGLPIVKRYGKYVLISPEKLELASNWVKQYGAVGIFTARLLPVVRHLISIPAGVLKMPFWSFTIATTLGAGLWCAVLAWFGREVLGKSPELMQSPAAMVKVMKDKLHWFVAAVVVLAVLYFVVLAFKKKKALAGRRA